MRAGLGRLGAALAEAGQRLVYRRQELAVLGLLFGSVLVGFGVEGLHRRAPALLERLEAEPERPLTRPRGDRPRPPHRVGGAPEGAPAPDPGPVASPSVPRPAPGAPRLDLNAASPAALERLPGIGPQLARRIIEERERAGPFRAVQDLRRVRGIGPKTLEALGPLVTVEAGEEVR